jgi:vancomycin resistance protein VanJ
LPPFGFLLPAPFVLLLTWRWTGRIWFALQIPAVLLAVFGLLGLRLGIGRDSSAAQDAHALRVVSYNVDNGGRGVSRVVAQAMRMRPNIVLMQELDARVARAMAQDFADWHTDFRDQFFVASRFPILAIKEPPALEPRAGEGGAEREGLRNARFIGYTLETPLGTIDVFNVHTTSPREGLEAVPGAGFTDQIREGHLVPGPDTAKMRFNATLRRRQVEALAAAARASQHPVILAGDFNLPSLSRVLHDVLADFDDGFIQAGRGFGYTFPTKLPFLRIDHVFTGRDLRVVDFDVGQTRASDHACISAVITRRS